MDLLGGAVPLPAGLYRIVPAHGPGIAKSNAWIAEITWVSSRHHKLGELASIVPGLSEKNRAIL